MGQNRKKHRINSHPIIHVPTSEGVGEQASERVSAAEGASEASSPGQVNERLLPGPKMKVQRAFRNCA